jgi:hypothetical protein
MSAAVRARAGTSPHAQLRLSQQAACVCVCVFAARRLRAQERLGHQARQVPPVRGTCVRCHHVLA